MLTRREIGRLALAAAPLTALSAKPDSKVKGVRIGAQSYSFRDRSLDEAIKAMASIGLSYVELWQGHIEPTKEREALKKWRTAPEALVQMKELRRKFNDAGIRVYALNYSFRKEHTDEEILQGMEMAKLLGTKFLTASSTVSAAPRIDELAKKAGVIVAMHNHSNLKPDEFARAEDFENAMKDNPNIAINLDIGHFTAANFDPIDYLQKNYKRIVTIHLKDRKKDQGENVPFGDGDTKIKEALALLKDQKLGIPAMIEYEYKGGDTVEEVKKCYEYCRKALLS